MTDLEQAQQERIGHLEVEVDQLRLQVRELKAQVYGPKSEKSRREEADNVRNVSQYWRRAFPPMTL